MCLLVSNKRKELPARVADCSVQFSILPAVAINAVAVAESLLFPNNFAIKNTKLYKSSGSGAEEIPLYSNSTGDEHCNEGSETSSCCIFFDQGLKLEGPLQALVFFSSRLAHI